MIESVHISSHTSVHPNVLSTPPYLSTHYHTSLTTPSSPPSLSLSLYFSLFLSSSCSAWINKTFIRGRRKMIVSLPFRDNHPSTNNKKGKTVYTHTAVGSSAVVNWRDATKCPTTPCTGPHGWATNSLRGYYGRIGVGNSRLQQPWL